MIALRALALVTVFWSTMASAQMNSDFSEWCTNRLRGLEQSQRIALQQLQAQDPEAAAWTLLSGLKAAADRAESRFGRSLTTKAIQRGRDNAETILSHVRSRQVWAKTIVNYLFAQYDFIRHVAQKLDIPYYRPAPCDYCQAQSLEIERTYVRFAMDQLRMPTRHLVFVERGFVYPLGHASAFLKATELAAEQTAMDLSGNGTGSLFAARYACLIDDLNDLSRTLGRWNQHRIGFVNEPDAVQQTYAEATRLLGRDSCGSHAPGHEPASSPVLLLSRPVLLHEGAQYTLTVPRGRALEKLVISAEGYNSEADVDVWVNGDHKGNFYVPRRDPAYYVNIGGVHTESVLFVVRRGSVRLLTVSAIYQ